MGIVVMETSGGGGSPLVTYSESIGVSMVYTCDRPVCLMMMRFEVKVKSDVDVDVNSRQKRGFRVVLSHGMDRPRIAS